jgi:hypothetical protein
MVDSKQSQGTILPIAPEGGYKILTFDDIVQENLQLRDSMGTELVLNLCLILNEIIRRVCSVR